MAFEFLIHIEATRDRSLAISYVLLDFALPVFHSRDQHSRVTDLRFFRFHAQHRMLFALLHQLHHFGLNFFSSLISIIF